MVIGAAYHNGRKRQAVQHQRSNPLNGFGIALALGVAGGDKQRAFDHMAVFGRAMAMHPMECPVNTNAACGKGAKVASMRSTHAAHSGASLWSWTTRNEACGARRSN